MVSAEPIVPAKQPKAKGRPVLRTTEATSEAVRALTRRLAVEIGRTPSHDEVIAAAISVADVHMPLLVAYVQNGATE